MGIIAEGGTGKSMLLKKLELTLIDALSKQDSEEKDDDSNANYLPLLVKCNALSPVNPSVEDYLVDNARMTHD